MQNVLRDLIVMIKNVRPNRKGKYRKDKWCPHYLHENDCIECSGNGDENVRYCKKCKEPSWHYRERCMRCKTYNQESPILFKIK